MMESIHSADGKTSIFYNADYTGHVQIIEYAGSAPRLEISRASVPCELLGALMERLLFNVAPKEDVNTESTTFGVTNTVSTVCPKIFVENDISNIVLA